MCLSVSAHLPNELVSREDSVAAAAATVIADIALVSDTIMKVFYSV